MTTYHGGLVSRIYQEYICITQSNTKVGKWPKQASLRKAQNTEIIYEINLNSNHENVNNNLQ